MEAQMLALPLVYAVADSFAGGSLGQWAKRLDERLPGRAAAWAAVVCAVAGYLALGPWGAAMALPWFLYRSPGWKVFGGSATPVGGREIVGTLARHLIAFLALPVVYWAGKDVALAAWAILIYALFATALAQAYGLLNLRAQIAGKPLSDRWNTALELCRGLVFGITVTTIL